jgi:hypothetical protein
MPADWRQGPRLAMWAWLCGPFWTAATWLVVRRDLYLGVYSLPIHLLAWLVFAGALAVPAFRRCLEGRCLLLYWASLAACFIAMAVSAISPALGHVVWFALLVLVASAIVLPPLRFTLRSRTEGRPGMTSACWLGASFASGSWLLFQLAADGRSIVQASHDGFLRDGPWQLHAMTLLLLILATARWPLWRHSPGQATVCYWGGTLLLALGIPAHLPPEVDAVLLWAMVACGLVAPLGLLPRWWGW